MQVTRNILLPITYDDSEESLSHLSTLIDDRLNGQEFEGIIEIGDTILPDDEVKLKMKNTAHNVLATMPSVVQVYVEKLEELLSIKEGK